MDYDQSVITTVNEVLPNIPASIVKDLMKLFPETDTTTCAHLVIQHILENENVDYESVKEDDDKEPVLSISNKSSTNRACAFASGSEAAEGEIYSQASTSITITSDGEPMQCNIDLNDYVHSSISTNSPSTSRSDSPDLKIVEEMTTCPKSYNASWDFPSMATEDNIEPINLTGMQSPVQQNMVNPDMVQPFDFTSDIHVQPNVETVEDLQNTRLFDEKTSVVVEKVLSILPDTPIERITGLVEAFGNYCPITCTEQVLQQLLEMNDAVQENQPEFTPDVIAFGEPWGGGAASAHNDTKRDGQIGYGDLMTEELKPKGTQKRKRSVEDHEKSLTDVTLIPTKAAVLDVDSREKFECNCCYDEVVFEDLVQCADGHLFCAECLRKYTEESVYGQGRRTLSCMFEGCDEIFPSSQLMRALPDKLRLQYEERIAEEVLNLANLENLSRCPFCNYQALLEDDQHIFACPNPTCQKRSCRNCGTIWEEHDGLECNQVEKEAETKIRTDYEEKMAEARIRTCPSCKARFTKESGCNKISCRCGQQLCYICRSPIKDYSHFCQHVRNPGKPCNQCTMCFLWTNADYDDELAISEIKEEATKTRTDQGFEEEKEIGAPNAEKKKKKFQNNRPNTVEVNLRHMLDVIDIVAAGGPPQPAHDVRDNQFGRYPHPEVQLYGRPPRHMPRAVVQLENINVPAALRPRFVGPFPPPRIQGLGPNALARPLLFAPAPPRMHGQRPEVPQLQIFNPARPWEQARKAGPANIGFLRAARIPNAPLPTGNPTHTSNNVLDNCQSLIQEHVRNMVGMDQRKAFETQKKLKNIAQQANRLANQLRQQANRQAQAARQAEIVNVRDTVPSSSTKSINLDPRLNIPKLQVNIQHPGYCNIKTGNGTVVINSAGQVRNRRVKDSSSVSVSRRWTVNSSVGATSQQAERQQPSLTSGPSVRHFGPPLGTGHQLHGIHQRPDVNNGASTSSGNTNSSSSRSSAAKKPEAALGAAASKPEAALGAAPPEGNSIKKDFKEEP